MTQRELNGRFELTKISNRNVPESRVIDEAIDAFYKTAMEGFKYLYPEQSEAESKDAIQKALAAHFGNPLAKELLSLPRGPTPWNGFVKDNYKSSPP
jgi:hypothetical protein